MRVLYQVFKKLPQGCFSLKHHKVGQRWDLFNQSIFAGPRLLFWAHLYLSKVGSRESLSVRLSFCDWTKIHQKELPVGKPRSGQHSKNGTYISIISRLKISWVKVKGQLGQGQSEARGIRSWVHINIKLLNSYSKNYRKFICVSVLMMPVREPHHLPMTELQPSTNQSV